MRGDPCPSVTTQQQIPGLLPGTGAIRLAIGDLVHSSVLVYQRALSHRDARDIASNGPTDSTSAVFLFHSADVSNLAERGPIAPECAHLFTMCASVPWGRPTPFRLWSRCGQGIEVVSGQGLASWEASGRALGCTLPSGDSPILPGFSTRRVQRGRKPPLRPFPADPDAADRASSRGPQRRRPRPRYRKSRRCSPCICILL